MKARLVCGGPQGAVGSEGRPRGRPLLLLRWMLPLLAVLGALGCASVPWDLISRGLGLPKPRYEAERTGNVAIPMRDGVRLAADIYRPKAEGAFPALLIRTPYDKRNVVQGYEIFGGVFATQGYVVVIQDVRGKYRSGGEFYPIVNEGSDGADTIGWIASQPWCNGKVGMFGVSYYGSTEWLAAPSAPDSLLTIVPIFTSQSSYDLFLTRGVFNYNLTLVWHYSNDVHRERRMDPLDYEKAVWFLPLIAADEHIGVDNPIYHEWIAHPVPGPFWERMRVDDRVEQIRSSALSVGGWFDPFLEEVIADYHRMRSRGGTEAARQSQLIIGPWTHLTESRFRKEDFGQAARFLGQISIIARWYDHWLKGEENGIDSEGPIRIFVMGRDQWRTEKEWPLARTRWTELYLHSQGKANGAKGDGRLSRVAPEGETPDAFQYDPADPVPSWGAGVSFGSISYRPAPQAAVEARDDVLVYTGDPLPEELEVTGPLSLQLYASSTALDTDFTARLTDVHPDGTSLFVTSGIVRARFRDSLSEPTPLEREKVYRYEIRLGATSYVFGKGHRLRLQVSSSDFPRHDRNQNTGAPIGMTAAAVPALQTVFHDGTHPSRLLLPVIP
jgi:putative CocE/NonD family hydrolase